jgi:6-phosphogluconolactonase
MDLTKQKKPNIVKVTDSKGVAQKTLEEFVAAAKAAIDQKGSFYVAISGGSTPEVFYELLSQPEAYNQIDWDCVRLFWVDERCVPPSAKASNFGMAANAFLLDVPIPGENVHRVTGEEADYAKAARDYERTILNVFGLKSGQMPVFDLILLGMGADGHTASLFPNSYVVFDTEDLVSAVYLMDGVSRITLTAPVLKAANQLIVMISGQAKSEIVRDVFQTEPDVVKYPVHTLWPVMDKILWIMDQQAGVLID